MLKKSETITLLSGRQTPEFPGILYSQIYEIKKKIVIQQFKYVFKVI